VPYRVYVIQNREGKFYIGLSDDVARRVEQHNTGQSRWTRGRGPWEIAWQSKELSLTDARKLENRLKRQGRGKGFYAIHWFASTQLIIRQLPDRGFKSRPRNQFLSTAVAYCVYVIQTARENITLAYLMM